MKTIKVKIIRYTSFVETSFRQTFDGRMYEGVQTVSISVLLSSNDITYNEAVILSAFECYEETKYDSEYDDIPDYAPKEYLHYDLSAVNKLGMHNFIIVEDDDDVYYGIENILSEYTSLLTCLNDELAKELVEAETKYKEELKKIEIKYNQEVKSIKELKEKQENEFWEDKFLNGYCLYNEIHPLLGDPLEWAFRVGLSEVFMNIIKRTDFKISKFTSLFVDYSSGEKLTNIIRSIRRTEDIDVLYERISLYSSYNNSYLYTDWQFEINWRGLMICIQQKDISKIPDYAFPICKKVIITRDMIFDECYESHIYYCDLVALIYNSNILRLNCNERSICCHSTHCYEDILCSREFLDASLVARLKDVVTASYSGTNESVPLVYKEEDWTNDFFLDELSKYHALTK